MNVKKKLTRKAMKKLKKQNKKFQMVRKYKDCGLKGKFKA